MSFQNKYLKYKSKYLDLKNQIGGSAGASIIQTHVHSTTPVNHFTHTTSKYFINAGMSTSIGGSSNVRRYKKRDTQNGNQDTGDMSIIDPDILYSLIADGHGTYGREVSQLITEFVKELLINRKDELRNDSSARAFLTEICDRSEEYIKQILIKESITDGFHLITTKEKDQIGVIEDDGNIIRRKYRTSMWENVSGGTTFTLIVMVGNLLYVIELGDSDAYLITPEPILSEAEHIEYIFDTIDSEQIKPTNETKTSILKISRCPSLEDRKEYDRIKASNGRVIFPDSERDIFNSETGKLENGDSYNTVKKEWAITQRPSSDARFSNGGLAMPRSLGDFNEKHYGISAKPVITCIDLNKIPGIICIFVASDGVHDNWIEDHIQKFIMDKSCLGAVAVTSVIPNAVTSVIPKGAFRVSESFRLRNEGFGKRNFGDEQDNATNCNIYLFPR